MKPDSRTRERGSAMVETAITIPILLMVMVGIFAWQLSGRALWLVPTSFVLMMAVGGALGVFGIDVPFDPGRDGSPGAAPP